MVNLRSGPDGEKRMPVITQSPKLPNEMTVHQKEETEQTCQARKRLITSVQDGILPGDT